MNTAAKLLLAACLATPLAAMAALGTDTSGTGIIASQVHTVHFTKAGAAKPVTITDQTYNEANAAKADGASVVMYSTFTSASDANTKYILKSDDVTKGLGVSFGATAIDTTGSYTSNVPGSSTTVYINVIKTGDAALDAGQYHATYTLSEFAS